MAGQAAGQGAADPLSFDKLRQVFHAVFITDHAINELTWVNPCQIYKV
ncbi:MAG: hypothetical protein SXV54_08255 [Chloroflexota bacterium]|nr:hypothetical protein [Chloroflexota bacterium]